MLNEMEQTIFISFSKDFGRLWNFVCQKEFIVFFGNSDNSFFVAK